MNTAVQIECRHAPPVTEQFYLLAPGVRGWAHRVGKEIHIPFIEAVTEGNGDVGRFLDSLPDNAVIVNVVNTRLAGMLIRRGFYRTWATDKKDYWRRY
jgi:hypothetical protein